MDAQSVRLRTVSENIANARSTGDTPGADPYQRKLVTFGEELDRQAGFSSVTVREIDLDHTAFNVEYDPGHPAADESGMVKLPNVNLLIEMADIREANRSYEANLQSIKQSRDMINSTIDLLRS
jgi:flagellar basal-body rod protein FlgC